MEQRIDPGLREEAVIDRVGRDAIGCRAVDLLQRAAQEVVDDLAHAVDAAGAHGVEELRAEFGNVLQTLPPATTVAPLRRK